MTVNQQFIEGLELSYGEMERMGFSSSFIEDYQAIKRAFRPLVGDVTPPNNNFTANQSGFYIYSDSPSPVELWFNPQPGTKTGWIQLV